MNPTPHPAHRILEHALANFSADTHEYGRPDMAGQLASRRTGERIDPSRLNLDADGDGRRGVDCSSLVYYALRGAGYHVESHFTATGFTTRSLFEGSRTTAFAREHFDVLPPSSKTDGSLQTGDLLMLRMPSGAQHIGIFQGYDERGRITFFGSQTSTGPATVTLTGNNYWDRDTVYLGALRPKDSFQIEAHRRIEQGSAREAAGAPIPGSLSATAQTLLQDARREVQGVAGQHGLAWDQGLENTVWSLAAAARQHGMSRIEMSHVQAGQIRIGQMDHGQLRVTEVDAHRAANTNTETSGHRLAHIDHAERQVHTRDLSAAEPVLHRSGPALV